MIYDYYINELHNCAYVLKRPGADSIIASRVYFISKEEFLLTPYAKFNGRVIDGSTKVTKQEFIKYISKSFLPRFNSLLFVLFIQDNNKKENS